MIALFQSLSAFAGLVSMVLLLIVSVVAGRYMTKSNINSAANEAQKSAIEAMKTEMEVLKGRIDDIKSENTTIKKDNTRLQLVMETIAAALKGMGLVISVEGELVRIKNESNNENIVQRIHGSGWPREEDK
jgi:hypothetical protein